MLHLLFECCFFERFYGVSSWQKKYSAEKLEIILFSDQEAK